jgi:hypothetical protein
MEQTIMFQYMFMQRLPVTLRTLLGEQEPGLQGGQAVIRELSLLHTMYVGWKTLIGQNMFDIVKSCNEMKCLIFHKKICCQLLKAYSVCQVLLI